MKIKWKQLVLLVPVFLIAVEVFDYFTFGLLSYFRGISLIAFVVFYFIKKREIKVDSTAIMMGVFLIYTFIITFNTTNYLDSILGYLSIFTSMSFYVIGINTFKRLNDLHDLKFIFYFLPILFLFNLLLYTGLNIGEAEYGGLLKFGNLHNNVIYTGSITVLAGLVFYKYNNKHIIHALLITTLLIIIFLSFRRTAIILIVVGLIIYLIMTNKKHSFKIVVVIVLLLVMLLPLYWDYLVLIYEIRSNKIAFEAGIDRESRFREMKLIIDQSFSFDDIRYSLFGMEYLNSPGTYSGPDFNVPESRPLHTDVAKILHGSGIIGLILYALFLIVLSINSIKSILKLGIKHEISIYLAILTTILLLVTVSGSILSIGFRTTYFIFLGMMMGISNNKYLLNKSS